ncbi:MAG: hypothetical protein JEY99_02195 [Spirochaetales bacterium]|nr:hypothetical protein [Spirochaetales bacterium]
MKRKTGGAIILLLLSSVFFFGCTIPDNTAEFWTNIPEITTYADLFNSQQDQYRIKIVYKEDPGAALLTGTYIPDLIISTNLNSAKYTPYLEDISYFFDPEKGKVDPAQFYQELLLNGVDNNGVQRTLPVSFNLPLLYYKTGNGITDESDGLFSNDDLENEVNLFTGKDNFPVRGFSSLWDGHYLYELTKLNGADFHETDSSLPEWNSEKLNQVLDTIRTATPPAPPKTEEDEEYPPPGSLEGELAFQEKYLYQPWFKSVNSGRILYAFTTMEAFYEIPIAEKKSLDIRWISDGQRVPVCDDVLYAGILKKGEDKKSAAAFLEWFFQQETQSAILESSQFKRIRKFGIARGFSSLYLVNQLEFPRFYSILVGKIPGQRELLFPEILPYSWEEIRKDVIIPWLRKESIQTENRLPLEENLRNWYNLRPSL